MDMADLDWDKLEEWLMTVDTSELIGFCGPMGVGMSFERDGTELAIRNMPMEHRDLFERVFKARGRDILLYIDTGGASTEVPTPENAARKAERIVRQEW
jgi:hypothetical protein